MKNLELYDKLKAVPENAKKSIGAGRLKGMTDINPMWRIKKLTEEFGVCGIGWKYVITEKRLEKGCKDQISAFVDIDLFVKINDKWSEAISGTGGASFVTEESKGLYQSDECFKMALTDAISVACKALGMGADVYFEKDRTKYEYPEDNKEENIIEPAEKPETIWATEKNFNAIKDGLMSGDIALIEKSKKNFKGFTTQPYAMKKIWKTELETIIKNIENGTV